MQNSPLSKYNMRFFDVFSFSKSCMLFTYKQIKFLSLLTYLITYCLSEYGLFSSCIEHSRISKYHRKQNAYRNNLHRFSPYHQNSVCFSPIRELRLYPYSLTIWSQVNYIHNINKSRNRFVKYRY